MFRVGIGYDIHRLVKKAAALFIWAASKFRI